MPDIGSCGTNYIFCNYYYLRFLSPYEYQSEVNILEGQLQIQIHIWVVLLELNLGSTPSPAPIYVSP